jgi:Domain of unknown function (DUF4148)
MSFCFDRRFPRMPLTETFRLDQRKEIAMKNRLLIVSVAATIALPVAVHAQTDGSGVTREQVREELEQLEHVGYQPGRNSPHYPDDLLAAEARIREAAGADPYAVNAVGRATVGRFASGSRVGTNVSQNALFAHN